jgi:hypothetical protein
LEDFDKEGVLMIISDGECNFTSEAIPAKHFRKDTFPRIPFSDGEPYREATPDLPKSA